MNHDDLPYIPGQPIPMRWVNQETLPIARLNPTTSAKGLAQLRAQLLAISGAVDLEGLIGEFSPDDPLLWNRRELELNLTHADDMAIPQLIQCCLDLGYQVGLCETFTTVLEPGDRCDLTTIQTRLLNELLEEVEDVTLTNPVVALASVYGAPLLTSNQFWVIPDAIEVLYRKFHTRVDLATVPPYLNGGIWELQMMTYQAVEELNDGKVSNNALFLNDEIVSDSEISDLCDDPIEDLILGETEEDDVSGYDPEYQRMRELLIRIGVGLTPVAKTED